MLAFWRWKARPRPSTTASQAIAKRCSRITSRSIAGCVLRADPTDAQAISAAIYTHGIDACALRQRPDRRAADADAARTRARGFPKTGPHCRNRRCTLCRSAACPADHLPSALSRDRCGRHRGDARSDRQPATASSLDPAKRTPCRPEVLRRKGRIAPAPSASPRRRSPRNPFPESSYTDFVISRIVKFLDRCIAQLLQALTPHFGGKDTCRTHALSRHQFQITLSLFALLAMLGGPGRLCPEQLRSHRRHRHGFHGRRHPGRSGHV